MNPIVFALRHPITVMVGVVAVLVGSALAVSRMRVDIFPPLNLPVIYVCQPYGGMDPQQMEGLIANYYEYHFLYINGIHHVESKNTQGVSLMKLYFHPGTDMAQAMAETVGYVNRSRAFMPAGTVNPFIMRFDTGSVPVGFLVVKAGVVRDTAQIEKEIVDLVRERIGPVAAFKTALTVPRLPKTRSGKILRGTIKKIVDGESYKMPATLEDPAALNEIKSALENRKNAALTS